MISTKRPKVDVQAVSFTVRRTLPWLSSLKRLRPGDIDAFFPSSEKLLLAEKHVLESEIKGMIDPESRIISLWAQELSQRFNSYSDTWEKYCASSSSYQTAPWNQSLPPNILPTTTAACNTAERSIAGGQEIKPLDRKRDEMKENLLLLHLTLLTTFKYVWILFSLNKGILAEMSNVSDRRDRKIAIAEGVSLISAANSNNYFRNCATITTKAIFHVLESCWAFASTPTSFHLVVACWNFLWRRVCQLNSRTLIG